MRALSILALLLIPAAASADVVGPEPTDCPTGTFGTVCHGLEYCALDGCATDGDCDAGEICQSRDLCIRQATCGGRRLPDSAPPPPMDTVEGTCSDTCESGTCESRMVCVPEGTPPGTGEAGCGCRIVPRGSGAGALLAALALLAFALRRRG